MTPIEMIFILFVIILVISVLLFYFDKGKASVDTEIKQTVTNETLNNSGLEQSYTVHEIINQTYDFTGFIEIMPYAIGFIFIFYTLKKTNFSLIFQILKSKKIIKNSKKLIQNSATSVDKIKYLEIIEHNILYNNIYLKKINSPRLEVLNINLSIVRDILKNDIITKEYAL